MLIFKYCERSKKYFSQNLIDYEGIDYLRNLFIEIEFLD